MRGTLVDTNVLVDVLQDDEWGSWSTAALDEAADAGYLADHAYLRYRRAGGTGRSPLPDFYIGAHAAVSGLALLTRDPVRYRRYFPTIDIIAP